MPIIAAILVVVMSGSVASDAPPVWQICEDAGYEVSDSGLAACVIDLELPWDPTVRDPVTDLIRDYWTRWVRRLMWHWLTAPIPSPSGCYEDEVVVIFAQGWTGTHHEEGLATGQAYCAPWDDMRPVS